MHNEIPTTADAVVVGAGVAGAATAILLAKAGLSILLLDQRPSLEDYKLLCTHFVQPVANIVFHDLGLGRLLEPDYSVRTKAAFRVPGGEIDTDGGYGPDDVTSYAHNLERSVMDPELRREAEACGVAVCMGVHARALERAEDGFVLSIDRGGTPGDIACRFLIAADGRNSTLAKLVGAPVKQHPNDRAAYFFYCRGIAAPEKNRSLFALHNGEMSFLYPLIRQRTLLSVYVKHGRITDSSAGVNVFRRILAKVEAHLPDVDFSRVEPESRVFGYKRYDNQIRPPVTGAVAFVGDASVSIDPMSGVGCSFALKAARLVADAVVNHPDDVDAAMAAYEEAHTDFFPTHIAGIVADSRVAKSDDSVAESYGYILRDEKLKRRYLALTARLITPDEFQKSYLMSVARASGRRPIPPLGQPLAEAVP